jgi:hypothetical protein
MLPFTLYGSCGFATVPLCCVIAFLLLGALTARAAASAAPCGRQESHCGSRGKSPFTPARAPGRPCAAFIPLTHSGGAPGTLLHPGTQSTTPLTGSHPAQLSCCVPGIEEIGVSIEEPFSILALQAICDSVSTAGQRWALLGVAGTPSVPDSHATPPRPINAAPHSLAACGGCLCVLSRPRQHVSLPLPGPDKPRSCPRTGKPGRGPQSGTLLFPAQRSAKQRSANPNLCP